MTAPAELKWPNTSFSSSDLLPFSYIHYIMSSSIPFNPELEDIDRSNQIVIITTVFTVLITLTTAERIGTKFACRIKFQIDDYLIVLSLV